jgi:hypothetical protein
LLVSGCHTSRALSGAAEGKEVKQKTVATTKKAQAKPARKTPIKKAAKSGRKPFKLTIEINERIGKIQQQSPRSLEEDSHVGYEITINGLQPMLFGRLRIKDSEINDDRIKGSLDSQWDYIRANLGNAISYTIWLLVTEAFVANEPREIFDKEVEEIAAVAAKLQSTFFVGGSNIGVDFGALAYQVSERIKGNTSGSVRKKQVAAKSLAVGGAN